MEKSVCYPNRGCTVPWAGWDIAGRSMISAVVLAAGTSSRMGEPKPLARVAGRPLLDHVLAAVRGSRAGELVVVLGHEAERVRKEILLDGARVVVNGRYVEGMSTSLRAGLRASDPKAEGFLIVLGDQPFVSSATLDALIEARRGSRARILIPTFHGLRGNPVLLDRSLSDEVQAVSGDRGCRAIFGYHGRDILEVPVDDPGILLDLDTKGQLERVREALERGQPLESVMAEMVPASSHADAPRAPDRSELNIRRRIDILALAQELLSRNEPFALATVVRIDRPTSGRPGYKAIIRPNREVIGWVGGSCAESALLAESLASLRDGQPRLLRLTPDARLAPPLEGVVDYVMPCHSGGTMDIYIEPHLPKPRLLIVGNSPVAGTLSVLGRVLDYRVVVVAPGAGKDDFPEADEVLSELDRLADLVTPDTYAAVATMGKYDETALRALVASPAAYVGLVASRRRAREVVDELRRAGLPAQALERLRSPAGIDLAAQTPEEIALSIIAEITSVRRTAGPREVAVVESVPEAPAEKGLIDVVCGMTVEPETPLRASHDGRTYLFCSEGCRSRFLESPEAFIA